MSRTTERPQDRHTGWRVRPLLAVALGALALPAQAQVTAAAGAPGYASPGREAIQRLFLRVDTDGDGRLSRQEAERLPAIAERFDEIDADHDGRLDPDEFHAGATAPMR
ncbi:EF-hand domain-containing protein [Caldimonas thermodepolymerans]|jgi:Ca2+-binding protein (EF-Hand superfamily)|nr:EF-hand domain-containing protein [Caldimonas thermodepolymerans]RDH95372.1 EF hand domain-containing protein [Caldimonas thermodepolymerans]TCP03150.1 EF hand domain-containing protein [Caldimonas thermodepolymerans]UZG44342.1 EF-hand domain-containing protein [Caldimonas thermodepolymerans]UZG48010.1 EF-hand domain-containing protein [Caldimonas thermodepolymerans]